MSRSYRSVYGWKDRDPWAKSQANRKVRQIPVEAEVCDGAWYRRNYDPWKICDWTCLEYSWQGVLRRSRRWRHVDPERWHRRK